MNRTAWLGCALGLLLAASVAAWAQPSATPAAGASSSSTPDDSQAEWVKLLSEKGLLWALAVAFGTGVLVSFTPCVYPMIPITIGIIGGRDEQGNLRRSLALSCVYVLGLALVYATLGVLAGLFGATVRALLMSAYLLVAVAVVFALLGLSMLGLFELQVPPALATRLQSVGGKGVLGVLLMGLVSGLVASPCVAAPLAGILTFVAVTGNALTGFLLLFAFAWGMGLLLIVVGTSAGALRTLPKSGEWMVDVKNLFGFLLLGAALYFVRTLMPEIAYHLALALCIIGGGLGFGALDSLPANPGWGPRAKRGLALLVMALGFYMMIGTLYSQRLLLPSGPSEAPAPVAAQIDWQTDIGRAFAQAKSEGKPVLIDFRADWCASCVEMEKTVFPRPEVVAAAAGFVTLRVDVTEVSQEEDELQRKYRVVGYPTLVVARGDGALVKAVPDFQEPTALVALLNETKDDG